MTKVRAIRQHYYYHKQKAYYEGEAVRLGRIFLACAFLALGLMGHGAAHAVSIWGPKNFDECILENMKGVTSDTAANAIYASCSNKFTSDSNTAPLCRDISTGYRNLSMRVSFADSGALSLSLYNGFETENVVRVTLEFIEEKTRAATKYDVSFLSVLPRTWGTASAMTDPTYRRLYEAKELTIKVAGMRLCK